MKKLISFFMAMIIFVLGIAVYARSLDNRVEEKLLSNKNVYQNVKFGVLSESDDLNKMLFGEDALLVMGSSEFNPSSSIEMDSFPLTLYKRENYDFNLVLLGQGHTQSLWHAIELGAIADNIQNKKVVLIISPQWFTEGGIAPEGFASLFSSKIYYEALKNEKISQETKKRIQERTESLLERSGNLDLLDSSYKDTGIATIANEVFNLILDFRNKEDMLELYGDIPEETKAEMSAEVIDYGQLMSEAEDTGDRFCTNNEFGIYDEYYETYIQADIDELKDTYKGQNYSTSQEYEDLELFIQVCKETGITPLLVNVPVNGRWYDYGGFSKEDREQYYQNIRDIAKEQGVEVADFSDKEYEKYFLCDIMHLGWKGWVYLDETFYEFYKKN